MSIVNDPISILKITILPTPFDLQEGVIPGTDTQVFDEIVLETPTMLITGDYYNPETQSIETYLLESLQHETLQSGSSFTSRIPKTFIGPITISFYSRYPLKTYSNITRAKNQFIGDPAFGYQSNSAEIRYNFSGREVHAKSTLYKRPITLRHNTAGSDNILFNYKILYKGKTSYTGSVYLSVDKTDDGFYSFDENG